VHALRNVAAFLAALVFAAGGILLLAELGVLNPYWVRIFALACIVTISVQGLNLIYGFTGLFSLGHAAFYGIGAYTSAYLMKEYGGDSQAAFACAIVAGGGAAAFLAFLVGIPTLRLTSDYLGIATLGFGVIMKVVFDNADAFLPELGGARGMTGIAAMTTVPWAVFWLLLSTLALRNVVHSSYGRALTSIREDEVAAETMGIDSFRYKLAGFVGGCVFAGVAGGLYAHLYAFLHPSNFDFFKSIDVLMIVVIGGLGSQSGALAASFGWVFLLEGLRFLLPPQFVELRWVVIPVMLVATMLLRPQGLFGRWELPFLRARPFR
jgi:branched-chain amino acid transport system permease protein